MGILSARAAAAAAACARMLTAGCGNNTSKPAAAVDDGKGPLSLVGGAGAQSIWAPKHAQSTWYASFGGFLPCRNASGDKIVLRDIRPSTAVGAPADVDTCWRHVPNASDRHEGSRDSWEPIGSTKGYPGHWREIQFRGDFTHGVAGRAVTQGCHGIHFETAAFDTLVVVLKVPASGLILSSFTVDYTDNGQAKSLKVPWRLVACGTKVTNADWCS